MPDTVLITRPEPGATETAARVAAMGLVPVVAPLLAVSFPSLHLPGPETIGAILMASGNAAPPFPAAWHGHPVLTVGAATARRARAAGFRDIVSADGDAAALVRLVRERFGVAEGPPDRPLTFLLAAGQGQSLTLAADLRAAGYRVIRRVVYAARPVARLPDQARTALEACHALTVLFFSAETARRFVRLVRAAGLADACRGREAVTIGAPAAMALGGTNWARVRVAGKPTQDEMLALLR